MIGWLNQIVILLRQLFEGQTQQSIQLATVIEQNSKLQGQLNDLQRRMDVLQRDQDQCCTSETALLQEIVADLTQILKILTTPPPQQQPSGFRPVITKP